MEYKIIELIQLQSGLVVVILGSVAMVFIEAAFDFIMCIVCKKWHSPFGFKSRWKK